MNKREQLERYLDEKGSEAFARQVIAAENLYPCCGAFRSIGHHPDCKKHPDQKALRARRRMGK